MLGTACRYATVAVPADVTARRQFVEVIAEKLTNDCIQGLLPDVSAGHLNVKPNSFAPSLESFFALERPGAIC